MNLNSYIDIDALDKALKVGRLGSRTDKPGLPFGRAMHVNYGNSGMAEMRCEVDKKCPLIHFLGKYDSCSFPLAPGPSTHLDRIPGTEITEKLSFLQPFKGCFF